MSKCVWPSKQPHSTRHQSVPMLSHIFVQLLKAKKFPLLCNPISDSEFHNRQRRKLFSMAIYMIGLRTTTYVFIWPRLRTTLMYFMHAITAPLSVLNNSYDQQNYHSDHISITIIMTFFCYYLYQFKQWSLALMLLTQYDFLSFHFMYI